MLNAYSALTTTEQLLTCAVVMSPGVDICIFKMFTGVRSGTLGCGTAVQVGRSQVRFLMVSLGFFVGIILPAALWPWCRLPL